jgi:predicted Rossmann fold flavoprotein
MPGKTLVVVGGGAAGFFCAVNAARMNPSLKVTLLEKTGKLLSKVRVSGGGRCNVTHACFDIGEMSQRYPRGRHFVKKTFYQFFTSDTVKWFEERGVKLKTEQDGRMFPVTDSSETIINCLLQEADRYRVHVRTKSEVKNIELDGEGFALILADTPASETVRADFLCIAGGGFPKLSQFDWMRFPDLLVTHPVPSLFTFNLPDHPITKLMGVSIPDANVKVLGTKLEERGPLLLTHWGMSGPVVLRLSAWGARILAEKKWSFAIQVNWLPHLNDQSLTQTFKDWRQEKAGQKIASKNAFGLPQRFWEFLLHQSEIHENMRWSDLPARHQNILVRQLTACPFGVYGKTTFKEEFVTAGGVDLAGVDPNSMESRKYPNLFFAGEILDVDGITGGYNFQHAWTSGFIAAKNIAARASG